MDIDEWQTRLERTFADEHGVFPYLKDIRNAENAYGNWVERELRGHEALSKSFLAFYYETLNKAVPQCHLVRAEGQTEYYSAVFLEYLATWRNYRATQNLFHTGCPVGAYALLRAIKDWSIVVAAIAQDISSYSVAMGLTALSPEAGASFSDFDKPITKHRKKGEGQIKRVMIGSKSGLSNVTQTELERWERLFHWEAHGSRLTTLLEFGGWLHGTGGITPLPSPQEKAAAMYVNRVGEISWMLHRILPYLQLSPNCFGKRWAERWSILDESLSYYVSYAADHGDRIACAITDFVHSKFRFDPRTSYVNSKNASD